jgi:hypothetical protein
MQPQLFWRCDHIILEWERWEVQYKVSYLNSNLTFVLTNEDLATELCRYNYHKRRERNATAKIVTLV